MGVTYSGYDFTGWATKNDLKCADGRTIRKDAFKVNDGTKVPLVWNHEHNSVTNILGHALLENRDEGVYTYGYFNNTSAGKDAREIAKHGDIVSLSIWANNLQEIRGDVLHGVIREVSLVTSGANPGAFIESVLCHGEPMDEGDTEAIIYSGTDVYLAHAEEASKPDVNEESPKSKKTEDDETVAEVFNTLSEKQKQAVAIIVGQVIEDSKKESKIEKEEETSEMKHNIFEGGNANRSHEPYLSHDDIKTIINDAKRLGTLRSAIELHTKEGGVIAHALDKTGMVTAEGTQSYGINDLSMLYPEYKNVNGPAPEIISRNMTWVDKLMDSVHTTPFKRIKSLFADITEDEARAKGYIKGKQKKEEVFTTLKRTTDPQTVYKKQKLDRDDILDVENNFDIITWLKGEMKVMHKEEVARAVLLGDGRPSDSDDKIQEIHIRPIASDVPLFNTKIVVEIPSSATSGEKASLLIDAIIRARKHYKGSGNPYLFTTEDILTDMLLVKDKIGQRIYRTEEELATALRVKEIVTVEPMEGATVTIDNISTLLAAIMVNPADYNIGGDTAKEADMFEDFDIDFNQMKYLMEKRVSGALIKPFSAVTFGILQDGSSVEG